MVEAHQWGGSEQGADFIIRWITEHGGNAQFISVDGLTTSISIGTLEGDMFALAGDWIIRGTRGEFYPCKPGPFADTFEEVEPPTSELD